MIRVKEFFRNVMPYPKEEVVTKRSNRRRILYHYLDKEDTFTEHTVTVFELGIKYATAWNQVSKKLPEIPKHQTHSRPVLAIYEDMHENGTIINHIQGVCVYDLYGKWHTTETSRPVNVVKWRPIEFD